MAHGTRSAAQLPCRAGAPVWAAGAPSAAPPQQQFRGAAKLAPVMAGSSSTAVPLLPHSPRQPDWQLPIGSNRSAPQPGPQCHHCGRCAAEPALPAGVPPCLAVEEFVCSLCCRSTVCGTILKRIAFKAALTCLPGACGCVLPPSLPICLPSACRPLASVCVCVPACLPACLSVCVCVNLCISIETFHFRRTAHGSTSTSAITSPV